jgi:hypothetical protein
MTRYTIRFPTDLYARVKHSAEENRRSVHAEILWLLERALDVGATVGASAPTRGQ